MKYLLECINQDNQVVEVLYDNTNNLFTMNGETMDMGDPDANYRPRAPVKSFSPVDPLGKVRDLKVLKIQMGMKCNYNCSYCSQSIHAGGAMDSNQKDAHEFLEKLETSTDGQLEKIEFWGGEPLVYIKLLKILIPELRKRYPSASFTMISNGSLLTNPIVDFLAENNVELTISHDGPGQALRGPDPLKNLLLKKVWKYAKEKLPSFGFNSVISPANCNVIETRKWFDKNFVPGVHVGFEGIVTVHDHADDAGNRFTEDQHSQVYNSVVEAIVKSTHEQDWGSYPSLLSAQHQLAKRFSNYANKNGIVAKCEMGDERVIAVDLKGNVLTCHNTDASEHKIGELTDLEGVKLDSVLHWSGRPKCNDCLVLHSCKGSCMYLDHEEFARTCDNEFLFHSAIFNATFFNMTGLQVVKATMQKST